jgi:phosphatidate cytidylyltransferase
LFREFGLRVASAVVLVPLVLLATWAGRPYFHLMVALAAVLMLAEWLRLTETRGIGALEWIRAVVLVAALALGLLGFWIQGVALLLVLSVVSFVTGHPRDGVRLWPVFGTLYIGIPCLSILWLRELPDVGRDLVFALLAVVWATDIGAYIAGRVIGGPKLAPKISPNKTWSGSIGGLVAAAVVGVGVATLTARLNILPALLLSVGVAIAAEIGDLFESLLKRRFAVKDSGALIPGHGGLLDRLDSMLLAAPVLAFVRLWV